MNKTKKKSLIVRMSPDLHKKMKLISVKNDCSLNEYVVKAFEEIIKTEKEKS